MQSGAGAAGFESGATGLTPPSKPDRQGQFLTDVIVELGFAGEEAVRQAEMVTRESGKTIEQALLESGALDERQLSRAIAERNGLDHVDVERFPVDMTVAEMIDRSAAQRYRAVPIAFASDGALLVALEDPFDTLGISDIEVMTKSEVRPVIASAGGIGSLIERLPDSVDSGAAAKSRPRFGASPPDPEPEKSSTPPPLSVIEQEPPEPTLQSKQEPASAIDSTPPPPQELAPPPETGPEPPQELAPPPETGPKPPQELESAPWTAPFPQEGPESLPQAPPVPGHGSEPDPPEPAVDPVQPTPLPRPQPESEPPEPAAQERPEPLGDLLSELRSLQEAIRRADAVAAALSRRIEAQTENEDRAQRLERELLMAKERIAEIEGRAPPNPSSPNPGLPSPNPGLPS
ncbi:MAG TPA: hypothetical protein VFZ41_00625 [Solirubrobacterales bacterium]